MSGNTKFYLLLLFFFFGLKLTTLNAQNTSYIFGTVTDSTGQALPFSNITIPALNKGVISDETGMYQLPVSPGVYEIQYSRVGYFTEIKEVVVSLSKRIKIDIILKVDIQKLGEVSVVHSLDRNIDITRIPVKEFELLPNPGGSLEALIKTLPGVSSSNELSSQYSVRGGNFDENLIYVNDIEIIRPFLIRSGQQEGLSFINPDLVSGIRFSAGGFEARYGDKLSSVLDVTYRNPQKAAGTLSASLLGGSIAVEGISKNKKVSLITGVRYKTTKLLLGSLDSKGEYEPNFTDWQMLLNYQLSKKLTVELLTNFANNSYTFIPQNRTTNFGTYSQVYNLKVVYDGREDDLYNSLMGSFSLQYKLTPDLKMKLALNAYSIYEQERFDISGAYSINELDHYPGSDTYGDSLLNIGVGGMFNHARNYLKTTIKSISYFGNWQKNSHNISWSVRYQIENFKDRLKEWDYIDSTGYSSPYSEDKIVLNNFASSENNLSIERISGFVQDALRWSSSKYNYTLNAGVRFHVWSLTDELLFSPRIRFSVRPNWKKDVTFYTATGVYFQPPLFKEMRDFSGVLNKNIKAQQSYHFLLGSEFLVSLWNRPFKYTLETYYKYLNSLIPYKVDNVRIKYTAKNNAKGYATGIDMKLYGEFVEGVESWVSLSLLSTREDLTDDYYLNSSGVRVEPGYYHRPTDQLFHINFFFQDYLPNNPTLRASLNLVFGTSFYVAPPRSARFDATYPLGSYRRVDLGLTKTIKTTFWPQVKSFWLGVEIFNLFDIKNKASFMWLQTVANQENVPNLFAVPNYLTSRRLNVKMTIKF